MPSFRAALTAATAAVLVTALAACSPPGPTSEGPTELRLGLNPTYFALGGSPLDGHYIGFGYFAGRATYESLLAIDSATSEYVPLLAESWDLAADRKRMTLHLRQDVDFTDGTHLDAAAVADFFEVLRESDGAIAAATIASHELAIEVVGEYELEFTTTSPMENQFFEGVLLGTGIASPEAARDRESLIESPVGTGPYLQRELVPGVSAEFERNPDYWNTDAFEFDELRYLVFEDEIAAGNALKSGQIDAAIVAGGLLPELEREGFEVTSGGGLFQTLIISDFTGGIVPALADVRVRQAIAMAFDQEAIATAIEHGYARGGDQPFSPVEGAYVEGADDRYPYDVEAARELMAEAGYAGGFDVTIPSTANVTYYPESYEPIIQQSLAEIGIRVSYAPQADGAALIGAWATNAYPIHFHNLAYTQTISQYQGATPGFGGHFADDPTYAELTAIVAGGSAEEAAAAEAELGDYLLEQSWFIPLTHNGVNVAHDSAIDVTSGEFRVAISLIDFRPAR